MTRKQPKRTVDIIAEIFGHATKDVISSAVGREIYYAPTIQRIPTIHLKPDIGCFVQFSGDYSGLMIINFSRQASMEYYRESMMLMGMPEDELAIDHTSDEVVDSIGELVNQLIGKARQKIEELYGLSAYNNQPKAICIMDTILLSIDSIMMRGNQCRRLSFKIGDVHTFHIELFFEQTEFILIDQSRLPAGTQQIDTQNIDIDAIRAESGSEDEAAEETADPFDIDALIAQTQAGD